MDWSSIIIAILGSGLLTTLLNFGFDRRRQANEIEKLKRIKMNEDKLDVYKLIVDNISECLNDIELAFNQKNMEDFLSSEKGRRFNEIRMKTYGYLCIYGTQKSVSAHEKLVEYILDTLQGKIDGNWHGMRENVMELLNEFRKDFDPKSEIVKYTGNR
jgi:hypothetical protein